jgi:thiol-disulfide isomerase/thioredoxin
MMKSKEMADSKEMVKSKDDKMMKSKWLYSDFSEEKLAWAKWNIVLFFHATWCPSCKSADKSLSSSAIPDWLTILKLDYDSNTELKQKYKVLSQHTFVQVDNKWNMIKKWSASRNIEGILQKIK